MVGFAGRSSGQSAALGPSPLGQELQPVDENDHVATTEIPRSRAWNVRFLPVRESEPSTIGLRRLRSNTANTASRLASCVEDEEGEQQQQQQQQPPDSSNDGQPRRGRSISAPEPPILDAPVDQGLSRVSSVPEGPNDSESASDLGFNVQPIRRRSLPYRSLQGEYDPRIVDILDVIDPEVSTLSSITNIQNSLFVPSLGRWIKRRPTYDLDQLPELPEATTPESDQEDRREDDGTGRPDALGRRLSLQLTMTGPKYAVLPEGVSLDGWSREEVAELNDYVRHMLHSRRSKFKRTMKAFGKYVRKPLGFFVTLYATLITLFGLAWVLFLIGWIYVGEKQLYVINVIDNVLVALFAIVGDGLAPFRAVDTYHMIFIAHYHHLTWKLRKQKALPKLDNKNDLPAEPATEPAAEPAESAAAGNSDLEAAHKEVDQELPVLTPKQQKRLVHHQTKFARSHTFYKPHETETHYAFPLNLLIAIVTLLDLHSCLQITLGGVTWGIDYRVRSSALTATILSFSIAVNITAGILISVGGRRTRKNDVVERMFRQELTEEALRRMLRDQSGAEGGEEGGDRLRRIEEAIEEADEYKEEEEEKKNGEKGGKGRGLPRPSLDAWRRKSSDGRSGKDRDGRMLSPGRKSLQEAGRFDTSVGREEREIPKYCKSF